MLILCEGNKDGIDKILLERIFAHSCRVLAVGSRFGMKHRIEVLRMVCAEPVFVVLDPKVAKRPIRPSWSTRYKSRSRHVRSPLSKYVISDAFL